MVVNWDKGFTLIEIILVLAIMAILGMIAVPTFINIKEKASETVCNANCLHFNKAIMLKVMMKAMKVFRFCDLDIRVVNSFLFGEMIQIFTFCSGINNRLAILK